MSQFIEASCEVIISILQEELHRKDQIKITLVINATYTTLPKVFGQALFDFL